MTNVWRVWSLTFITDVNTNNIVMWEILPNNADWDCLKTLILQEISKTQNQQQEYCVYSEVTRPCQQVGCARNRLQVLIVATEADIISLDAGLRMDGIPALDLWNLVIEVFHCNQNQPSEAKDSSAQGILWCALERHNFSVHCDVVRVRRQ